MRMTGGKEPAQCVGSWSMLVVAVIFIFILLTSLLSACLPGDPLWSAGVHTLPH
jgi:hypothetical protein